MSRVVMMGTGTFARPTFEALVAHTPVDVVGLVTQPDRDGAHVRGSTRQTGESLKEIAIRHNIPVAQPASVNTSEALAVLGQWRPDLLVVAAFGQILKAEVLATARCGGINVHGSLLPKYRGAAPVAWAILRGETTTGVTIIRMTTGLDAGAMLAQEAVAIDPHETAGEVEARLAVVGARLAVGAIDEVIAGSAVGQPQDPALVTKAPKLTKEQGLIDWSRPAEEIGRHVRAMQPWPTAYTFLHRRGHAPERVIVTRATAIPDRVEGTAVGSILPSTIDHLRVAAGHGTVVEIVELQPAGKKRMTAGEFRRGRQVVAGDRFGTEISS